jgi:hypothetical protein
MISSMRPPLALTNGPLPWWQMVARRPVQTPECWQIPRLSKIVALLAGMGIPPVGNPAGVLLPGKAGRRVAAVAQRLER